MRITDTKGREYILCAIETDEGEQRYRPIVAGNANPLTGEKFEPSDETVRELARVNCRDCAHKDPCRDPLDSREHCGARPAEFARAILLALGSQE